MISPGIVKGANPKEKLVEVEFEWKTPITAKVLKKKLNITKFLCKLIRKGANNGKRPV